MHHIELITQERNPFTEKVARALALKKVEYERVIVSEPAEIRRASPVTHKLPVLRVGAERRDDSSKIIRWLDELFPQPPLLANDSKVAEAQSRLAEWSDSSFAFYWDRWRTARFPLPGDEEPADPSLWDRVRDGVGGALRWPRPPSRGELRELQVIEGLSKRLDDLVGFLGDRAYFHANQPSLADLAVMGMLTILRDGPIPGSNDLIQARPTLVSYMGRVDQATGFHPE